MKVFRPGEDMESIRLSDGYGSGSSTGMDDPASVAGDWYLQARVLYGDLVPYGLRVDIRDPE